MIRASIVLRMSRIAENWTRFGKVPMLEPADSEECKDFTKTAFEISEAVRYPCAPED